MLLSTHRRAAVIFATASIGALAGAGGTEAITVTATVPNQFSRDCSYITHRCTGYHQINGAYNPRVSSSYSTRWVWRWI